MFCAVCKIIDGLRGSPAHPVASRRGQKEQQRKTGAEKEHPGEQLGYLLEVVERQPYLYDPNGRRSRKKPKGLTMNNDGGGGAVHWQVCLFGTVNSQPSVPGER